MKFVILTLIAFASLATASAIVNTASLDGAANIDDTGGSGRGAGEGRRGGEKTGMVVPKSHDALATKLRGSSGNAIGKEVGSRSLDRRTRLEPPDNVAWVVTAGPYEIDENTRSCKLNDTSNIGGFDAQFIFQYYNDDIPFPGPDCSGDSCYYKGVPAFLSMYPTGQNPKVPHPLPLVSEGLFGPTIMLSNTFPSGFMKLTWTFGSYDLGPDAGPHPFNGNIRVANLFVTLIAGSGVEIDPSSLPSCVNAGGDFRPPGVRVLISFSDGSSFCDTRAYVKSICCSNAIESDADGIPDCTSPSLSPTVSLTMSPTMSPAVGPTMGPTMSPAVSPTMDPTMSPTMEPTTKPTASWMTLRPTTGSSLLASTIALTGSTPSLGPTTMSLAVSPTEGPRAPTSQKNTHAKVVDTVSGVTMDFVGVGELTLPEVFDFETVTEDWYKAFYDGLESSRPDSVQVRNLTTSISGTDQSVNTVEKINSICYDQTLVYIALDSSLSAWDHVLRPFLDAQAKGDYAARLQTIGAFRNVETPIPNPSILVEPEKDDPQTPMNSSSSLPMGVLIGAIVGSLSFVAACMVVVLAIRGYRKRHQQTLLCQQDIFGNGNEDISLSHYHDHQHRITTSPPRVQTVIAVPQPNFAVPLPLPTNKDQCQNAGPEAQQNPPLVMAKPAPTYNMAGLPLPRFKDQVQSVNPPSG